MTLNSLLSGDTLNLMHCLIKVKTVGGDNTGFKMLHNF